MIHQDLEQKILKYIQIQNEKKSRGEVENDAVFVPTCKFLRAEFKLKNIPIDPKSLSNYSQWQDPNEALNNTNIEETTENGETVTGNNPNNVYDALEEGGL